MAAAFLERFPDTPRSVAKIATPTNLADRRERPGLVAWAGAALALAAGFLLFLGVRPDRGSESAHGTRTKGSERIGFIVRRGERVFDGSDGERVYPGDQLRFVAITQEPRHVAILSWDAAGVASVYYPTAATHARRLTAAESGPLDGAVELDATLGRERLFGVFCDAPFEVEPLRAALERQKTLVPPFGCQLDELEIVKEQPK